jgi:hypothetical protein
VHAAAAKLINPGGFGFGQIPGPSSSLFRRRTKKIYQPSKDIIFQPYVVLCIVSSLGIEDTLRMSCSGKRPGPSEVSRTINLATLNLATQHDTISYPTRKRLRVSVVAG